MKQNSVKNYFLTAVLLAIAIAIMIHFQRVSELVFGDDDNRHGAKFVTSFSHISWEFIITVVIAFLMFTLNYFILKPLRKHHKLSVFTILLAINLTVISVFVLNDWFFSLLNTINPEPKTRGFHDEFIYRNFFVSGLVIGCILIYRLINQKQLVQIENETLKNEALQSQFESLKNQLSPHFLFNSLTALKTLINESPEIAQDYVNNLSKALRYTLQSNEKQLVTLQEEMEFTGSYLFLVKMRFDTNLSVNIQTDDKYLNFRLPPLTVQTLVENAVKHNEVSRRKPLNLTIMTTERASLQVINTVNEKITREDGTGIGLSNLSKQFHLLLGKDITISIENNEFIVEVPLINP
jgi:uncharacterized membrane-anchored protein YhcB (DUF1043 family)